VHFTIILVFGLNLGPFKEQILAKIAEIASWSKCTVAGAMNGRLCWLVQSNVLDRYNLAELSVINTWEFANETKKLGRKTDDSRTEEDTPPAKTPRMSLLKKFVQSASSSARKVSSAEENELPEAGEY
jgi:chromatin assembly factor 1 subunit A